MYPDSKLQFCVFDKQNGVVHTPRNLRWSVQRGSITASGEYTSPRIAGKYRIIVMANNQRAQALVYVKLPGKDIPQSIQIIAPKKNIYEKQQVQLQATAYNHQGNEVHFSPMWRCSGGGTISSSGVFSATQSGKATIQVRDANSPLSAVLELTIYANNIKRVAVSPKSTTVLLGQKMRFFALAYDDKGNEVPFKPRWYVEGQGSVKQTGEYTAGSYRGNAKVWAKDPVSGKKGYATLTVDNSGSGGSGTIEIGTALIHNSYTLRIAYQVLGINIHRTKLFAIQPSGSKQLLAEQTCDNGRNIVFEKQFPYQTIAFEIQVLDNYNRVVGTVRRTLEQLK
ncbi:hypothetical protein UABAM_00213 [Candidatus Uabimicrobium amorphum]|uniref:BIG2 domain-containing protein n=2 Tax=Uabimicrobium amorphum TaxID=2596890 RepID=A0A5S9F163_UABAM|nr:hypothetical protein UABAM_00213 [Candidatus Uabimicrobium amorphum]